MLTAISPIAPGFLLSQLTVELVLAVLVLVTDARPPRRRMSFWMERIHRRSSLPVLSYRQTIWFSCSSRSSPSPFGTKKM